MAYAIMLAWVDGEEIVSVDTTGLDLGRTPRFTTKPRILVAAWKWNGTEDDITKARAHAAKENQQVFVYPADHKDPKGECRRTLEMRHSCLRS